MFNLTRPRFIEITTDANSKATINIAHIAFITPLCDGNIKVPTRGSVICLSYGATQSVLHTYDELKAMIARA